MREEITENLIRKVLALAYVEVWVLTSRITVNVQATNVALMMRLYVSLVLEVLLWATQTEVLAEVGHLDDTVAVGGEGVQM